MILLLRRSEHCPRERQYQRELLKFTSGAAVGFTGLVTMLPNDLHETADVAEYTDPHHTASVPHVLVLAPGRVIDKVYVGYWFWGRPSIYQLSWPSPRRPKPASAARRRAGTAGPSRRG
jgi:hypothetical protein